MDQFSAEAIIPIINNVISFQPYSIFCKFRRQHFFYSFVLNVSAVDNHVTCGQSTKSELATLSGPIITWIAILP